MENLTTLLSSAPEAEHEHESLATLSVAKTSRVLLNREQVIELGAIGWILAVGAEADAHAIACALWGRNFDHLEFSIIL